MPSSTSTEERPSSQVTFREAYGILQKHADTLRRQQDPNIDELVNIVTESVNAYRVCKERISAVEQALQRTLSEVDESELGGQSAAAPAALDSPVMPAESGAERPTTQGSRGNADFDDDIPF